MWAKLAKYIPVPLGILALGVLAIVVGPRVVTLSKPTYEWISISYPPVQAIDGLWECDGLASFHELYGTDIGLSDRGIVEYRFTSVLEASSPDDALGHGEIYADDVHPDSASSEFCFELDQEWSLVFRSPSIEDIFSCGGELLAHASASFGKDFLSISFENGPTISCTRKRQTQQIAALR